MPELRGFVSAVGVPIARGRLGRVILRVVTETIGTDRYALDALIARGGMGAIWRATDQVLGRPVAIKFLHEHLAGDPAARTRFEREARTAASLSHPNMANVLDYLDGERPGIVMELIEGETLTQVLERRGRLPVQEAVAIAGAALAALDVAHRAGVVHRDVKPGNILMAGDGGVKVADFGIARTLGDSTLTATGGLLATPHYVSPEQLRGEPATPASDVFGLGVLLWEMLAGERPFEGDSSIGIAMARLNADVPPIRDRRPEVPPALATVIGRATATEPSERFAAAGEMLAALRSIHLEPERPAPPAHGGDTQVLPLDQEHTRRIDVPPPPAPRPAPVWWTRLRRQAGLIAFGVFAVVAGTAIFLALPDGSVGVPTLVGSRLSEATRVAEQEGLIVEVERVDSVKPAGQVLDQEPAAQTTADRGSTVTLTVSRGNLVRVPSLVGYTLHDALVQLGAAGLAQGEIVEQETGESEPGTVLAQSPGPGETVERDGSVDLVVEAEPPPDDHGGRGKPPKDD